MVSVSSPGGGASQLPPVTLTPVPPQAATPTAPAVKPIGLQPNTAAKPTDAYGRPTTNSKIYHLNTGSDEDKEPTMAIVQSAVTQAAGISFDNPNWHKQVVGFSSEMPKDASGNVVLKSHGDPKCFAADITFKVNVRGPANEIITVEFTQLIVTSLPLPLGKDRRGVHDAQIEALFKFAGFRQSIEEPLLNKQNKRIQELVGKATLQVSSVRDVSTHGLYGKKVEWEKLPKPNSPEARIQDSYAVRGQMSGVLVEGKAQTLKDAPETIWTTKVYCEELETQKRCLEEIEKAAHANDTAEIKKQIDELRNLGLTLNQIVIMINRNCIHDFSEIKLNFLDTKKPLEAKATSLTARPIQDLLQNYRSNLESLSKLPLKDPKEEAQVKADRERYENHAKQLGEMIKAFKDELKKTYERTQAQLMFLALIQTDQIDGRKLKHQSKQELRENMDRLEKLEDTFVFHKKIDAFETALEEQKKELHKQFGAQLPGWH